MKRVPAALVVLLLAADGRPVSAATLRKWVQRGHITRGPGGYCLAEIVVYLDTRDERDGVSRREIIDAASGSCHATAGAELSP